jgi:hypothetical protein
MRTASSIHIFGNPKFKHRANHAQVKCPSWLFPAAFLAVYFRNLFNTSVDRFGSMAYTRCSRQMSLRFLFPITHLFFKIEICKNGSYALGIYSLVFLLQLHGRDRTRVCSRAVRWDAWSFFPIPSRPHLPEHGLPCQAVGTESVFSSKIRWCL